MLRLGEVTPLKSVYTNLGDNEQPRTDTDGRSLKTNRAITTQSRAGDGHTCSSRKRAIAIVFVLVEYRHHHHLLKAVPSGPFEKPSDINRIAFAVHHRH